MGEVIQFSKYREITVEQAQNLIDGIANESLLGSVVELAQSLDLYTLRQKAESGHVDHRPLYRLIYDIRKRRGEVEKEPSLMAIVQGRNE